MFHGGRRTAVRQRIKRTVVVWRLTLLSRVLVRSLLADEDGASGSGRCNDRAPSSRSGFREMGRRVCQRWVVKKERSRWRSVFALCAS
jgi:hypothetical protein